MSWLFCLQASAFVITYPVNNVLDETSIEYRNAVAWEKAFIQLMKVHLSLALNHLCFCMIFQCSNFFKLFVATSEGWKALRLLFLDFCTLYIHLKLDIFYSLHNSIRVYYICAGISNEILVGTYPTIILKKKVVNFLYILLYVLMNIVTIVLSCQNIDSTKIVTGWNCTNGTNTKPHTWIFIRKFHSGGVEKRKYCWCYNYTSKHIIVNGTFSFH